MMNTHIILINIYKTMVKYQLDLTVQNNQNLEIQKSHMKRTQSILGKREHYGNNPSTFCNNANIKCEQKTWSAT